MVAAVVLGTAGLVWLSAGRRCRGRGCWRSERSSAVVWGWGIAQYPDILPGELSLADAAAPSGALEALLVVFVVAALLIAPSLGLLYTLTQRNRLGGHA